jgi:hypothetical protein
LVIASAALTDAGVYAKAGSQRRVAERPQREPFEPCARFYR